MPHVICEPCVDVKDTTCTTVCPVNCIHPLPTAGDFKTHPQLYINPGLCIDCGDCVSACPESAIFPRDSVPVQWQPYIQINADYYA